MAHRVPASTAATTAAAAGTNLRRQAHRPESCLGRTCMKWGADGELSSLDLQLVLERLSRVDGCADALVTSARVNTNDL